MRAKLPVIALVFTILALMRIAHGLRVYVYTVQDAPALEKLIDCKNYEEVASGQWGTSIHIYNWLQRSKVRTLDPGSADFFFVPAHGKCIPTNDLNQTFLDVITQLPFLKCGTQITSIGMPACNVPRLSFHHAAPLKTDPVS
jgi:hypothetical protein